MTLNSEGTQRCAIPASAARQSAHRRRHMERMGYDVLRPFAVAKTLLRFHLSEASCRRNSELL